MESAAKWKRIAYLMVGLSAVQFMFIFHDQLRNATPPRFSSSAAGHRQEQLVSWKELDKGPDGEFIDDLSDAQCDVAFPDLYQEVDRATSYWKERNHTISKADVGIQWSTSAFRVLVHENQIRILESKSAFGSAMSRSRCMQTIHLLHRAVESATVAGEVLPTVELAFTIPDITEMPKDTDTTAWTWNRRINDTSHDRHWMVPNFSMWRGDGEFSYPESRVAARKYDLPFKSKIPKIVWRGAVWVNHVRGALMGVTKDKSWADVVKVAGEDGIEHYLGNDELCKYAMTAHTEGISYSARLDWVTECNSLLFIHDLEWTTWYYHLLKASGPDQNYVAVKRDWSDLEEKVKYYLDHPNDAEKIIENSLATFRDRYLTRAAASCYYRRLIRGYAEVSYTPEIHRSASDTRRTLRGMPYEMFIIGVTDFGEHDV